MRAQRWWFAGAFAGTVSLFVIAAWAISQKVGTTSGLRRVDAWPDAARWYLLYRERVAPIVPPAGREPSRETLAFGISAQSDDSDGDGMPDGWEVAAGLNPLANDAAGSPDDDDLANMQEYTAAGVHAGHFPNGDDPHPGRGRALPHAVDGNGAGEETGRRWDELRARSALGVLTMKQTNRWAAPSAVGASLADAHGGGWSPKASQAKPLSRRAATMRSWSLNASAPTRPFLRATAPPPAPPAPRPLPLVPVSWRPLTPRARSASVPRSPRRPSAENGRRRRRR